jgi:asparagine synthase (glutamine-hydrolysing)
MTALGGYWAVGAGGDPLARCSVLLGAQADCGNAVAVAEFGDIAMGRRLFPLLLEDRFDRQPLFSASGRYALVADLRLDNRDELADALGFDVEARRAVADAALLLTGIERHGIEVAEQLLGDFAFACFDRSRASLHLVRDPLGQRPLFWRRGNGFIAFASMPRGIDALDDVRRAPDAEAVARYLAQIAPRIGQSFFAGIDRVPPGHVVTINTGGETRRRYWAPERRELRLPSFGAYVEAFRAELDSAVARRLRGAESVIASHLSGGWDSSAVTATAARAVGEGARLVAFTSVPMQAATGPQPEGRFVDEGALAAATASLYPNIEHVLVPQGDSSPVAAFDRQRALFERPVFNPCNHVWLAAIRTAARDRGARILLTGEIGNWTISAAPASLLADFLRTGRWLSWARESAAMLVQRRARLRGVAAASFGPWLPAPLWRRLARFGSAAPAASRPLLTPMWRTRLETELGLRLDLQRPPSDHFADAREALSEMDFGDYRKGILAGWGIDKRDATADLRLIEFCLSLPLEMLMADGTRRPLARAALADRLPQAVLDERRKGYQAADWHVGLSRDRPRIAELIERIAADEEASSVVDVACLRGLLESWPEGGWHRPEIVARYRVGMLQALAAGHFLLSARQPAN